MSKLELNGNTYELVANMGRMRKICASLGTNAIVDIMERLERGDIEVMYLMLLEFSGKTLGGDILDEHLRPEAGLLAVSEALNEWLVDKTRKKK
jgi:hypothetical protein